jgi:predicted transposase/invertase (TIGR01784 family)
MEHDNSYKLLFSHPRMVEDLLKGFVPEPWVDELDFSTLEVISGNYVADDLRDREDDIIWRVRWGQDWLYVYLLLEFQSRVDPFMAVRIMTYMGLLHQDLIRQKQLTLNGKLPPVLPIVLYNGVPRWRAATDVQELVETVPGGLDRYRPSLRYLLLDEGALDESPQRALRNLAAALFALEKSGSPEQMRELVGKLSDWLQSPEQTGLRRAFTVWIKRVLLPGRMPGVEIPQINDLQEVKAMLAERVIEWTEQWKQEGLQQGIQQGMQQGMQQGEARILLRLLARRFGELPEDKRRQIESADTETLLEWSERVLTANSLDEVLH